MFNLLAEEEVVKEMGSFLSADDFELESFRKLLALSSAYCKELVSDTTGVNSADSQRTLIVLKHLIDVEFALVPILDKTSIFVDDLQETIGVSLSEALLKAGVIVEVTHNYKLDHYAVTGDAYRVLKTYKDISESLKKLSVSIGRTYNKMKPLLEDHQAEMVAVKNI